MLQGSSNTTIIHKDHSSAVSVSLTPSGGFLRKDKPGRSLEASMRELTALAVAKKVLVHYGQTGMLKIDSPEPFGLVQDGVPNKLLPPPLLQSAEQQGIYMSWVPGVNGEGLISGQYALDGAKSKDALLESFFEHLGLLFALKEKEGWVHSDFQLRHVLFEEGSHNSTEQMSLIDLENLHMPETVEVSTDHIDYFGTLIRAFQRRENEKEVHGKRKNVDGLAILDLLGKHPLAVSPAMKENVVFMNQLFEAQPLLHSYGQRINGNRSVDTVLPYSIFGAAGLNRSRREVFQPSEQGPVPSASKMHRAYRLLEAVMRGYSSLPDLSEKPITPDIIREVQQDMGIAVDLSMSNKLKSSRST